MALPAESLITPEAVRAAVRATWGYEALRPLQEQAIQAGLARRDSLVVMPTGGGKSLCYQVPPLVARRTDVVVSPLIALMKDQVDGLRACGYPAAAVYSGQLPAERRGVEEEILAGRCRLVFLAPERLLGAEMRGLLGRLDVGAVAIDEAHCISHWGHDFRKEYRQLAGLDELFPRASRHAYTATATPQVRDDIVAQLRLRDPEILVGRFDRPNLVYRVVPRLELLPQVREVLERHRGDATIIYCITRKQTETLAAHLQAAGVRAACYHAGLTAEVRRVTQEAFAQERLDVVVATVAFGMGIDRSDVRCVIHAGMPKTIEHYQQETGRAGRDGLPAECVLLYSPADAMKWEGLIRRSCEEAAAPPEVVKAALDLLARMRNYCAASLCRHKFLAEYFGQTYPADNCGACEECLGEVAPDPAATVLAQKIISCVARVEQRFGVQHIVKVLTGANDAAVRSFRHEQLSTFGLLKEYDRSALTNLVFQLIEQGLLDRTPGDRPIVKLNAASREILRGTRQVRLVQPRRQAARATQLERESWEGVDRALFEKLRQLRHALALERGVPAYLIFNNVTLREMARRMPTRPSELLSIPGVGQHKLRDVGPRFAECIRAHLGVRAPQKRRAD